MLELEGNIVDVRSERVFGGRLVIDGGKIQAVEETGADYDTYLAPGLIDGHIHIESSMLCPSRFAEAVVPSGTTAVVTDPHEIANVMGTPGIDYMIKDSESVPLKTFFTAPSCVPATPFETSGAVLGPEDIEVLLSKDEVVALGEMMNFPGVINEDPVVMAKLEAAKAAGKPVDGHAPMLSGTELGKYVGAGISTEHECTTLEEAREKAKLGMKIMMREGSATKNLEALAPLASEFDNCFLVSDDKHPEDLRDGHVNAMLRKAVLLGVEPIRALRMATLNPAEHYRLGCGALEKGMTADVIEFDNLKKFNINRVFIDGKLAAEGGRCRFETIPLKTPGTISITKRTPEDFRIYAPGDPVGDVRARVIRLIPDNIVTGEDILDVRLVNREIRADPARDIVKLAVVNRYNEASVAAALITGLGIKNGAVASSVAHDSHNIIAAGTDDSALAKAVNTVIANAGGFAVVNGSTGYTNALTLPVAGLMSTKTAETVAQELKTLHEITAELGSSLKSPFLTLSFMALLVIPELKLSDKGLFDGRRFQFVDLVAE